MLAGLPRDRRPARPRVSADTGDDAGVYQLSRRRPWCRRWMSSRPAWTTRTPFGQIAAANSLSDVYAMGGKPLTALSIIGFPIETLSPRIMNRMLQGGVDKMAEAGVPSSAATASRTSKSSSASP